MNYLLEQAKAKLGSDRKVAKYLNITESRISSIRHGRLKLTPYQCGRLAELIGERWSDHVLPALIEKAQTPAEKDYWLGKLQLLKEMIQPAKKATPLAVILLTSLLQLSGAINHGYQKQENDSMYIMLTSIGTLGTG